MPEISPKKLIEYSLARIAQQLPNFKQRPAQHEMIAAVADTFSRAPKISEDVLDERPLQNGESILVIEGPTGTGKSLAYLLPAVVMARALGKKLVVSSATVTLQEQLAHKDIPFLAQHAGLNISYAIAKGRGRYLCTYRLKQLAGNNPMQVEMFEDEKTVFTQLLGSFTAGLWSGDRDGLAEPVADNVWSQITNDRHGCLKKNCPDFIGCSFYAARQKLEDVDIIIANHDLLLADIAMGGGIILPEPSETFYCLDEAHRLVDKAIQQFAASHTINGTIAWLEKIDITVSKALLQLKNYRLPSDITDLAKTLVEYLQDFSRALAEFSELRYVGESGSNAAILRFKHGKVPAALAVLCDNLARVSNTLLVMLNLLQDSLKKAKANSEGVGTAAVFDRILIDLGFFIGRVENVVAVWTLFAQNLADNEPPIAKWITAEWSSKKPDEQVDYIICASPVSAAKILSERFWCNIAGAVLTSATLRSLGSFDLLLTETGLKEYAEITCIALESPFNFPAQGKLMIPAMRSNPKDPYAHTQELIALLPTLLPDTGENGSLVLFSSKKQMLDVAKGLPENFQKLLLIQGDRSKEILLSEHFARIKNSQPSVLFGLSSFAEGLDLPGNACNLLIIAKLPFAVPDDPVSETLADWITQKGGNSFMEMALPATSIKLIQAVGRLIRSETDTGMVVIMDTRLQTTHYGKLLRNSLPPFTRVN